MPLLIDIKMQPTFVEYLVCAGQDYLPITL